MAKAENAAVSAQRFWEATQTLTPALSHPMGEGALWGHRGNSLPGDLIQRMDRFRLGSGAMVF
jgi:hypothetical protein